MCKHFIVLVVVATVAAKEIGHSVRILSSLSSLTMPTSIIIVNAVLQLLAYS
jgi:hypothetical protein